MSLKIGLCLKLFELICNEMSPKERRAGSEILNKMQPASITPHADLPLAYTLFVQSPDGHTIELTGWKMICESLERTQTTIRQYLSTGHGAFHYTRNGLLYVVGRTVEKLEAHKAEIPVMPLKVLSSTLPVNPIGRPKSEMHIHVRKDGELTVFEDWYMLEKYLGVHRGSIATRLSAGGGAFSIHKYGRLTVVARSLEQLEREEGWRLSRDPLTKEKLELSVDLCPATPCSYDEAATRFELRASSLVTQISKGGGHFVQRTKAGHVLILNDPARTGNTIDVYGARNIYREWFVNRYDCEPEDKDFPDYVDEFSRILGGRSAKSGERSGKTVDLNLTKPVNNNPPHIDDMATALDVEVRKSQPAKAVKKSRVQPAHLGPTATDSALRSLAPAIVTAATGFALCSLRPATLKRKHTKKIPDLHPAKKSI